MADTKQDGPGRPPLPEEDRKSKVVRMRVTRAEKEELESAASAERKTLSEWLLHVALRAARRQQDNP